MVEVLLSTINNLHQVRKGWILTGNTSTSDRNAQCPILCQDECPRNKMESSNVTQAFISSCLSADKRNRNLILQPRPHLKSDKLNLHSVNQSQLFLKIALWDASFYDYVWVCYTLNISLELKIDCHYSDNFCGKLAWLFDKFESYNTLTCNVLVG